ncbi:MAG: flagellar hook-length control protein FliK, partial [Planctomycetota bacterium]|nr:flagellar hook-length control protein FliK [Planctomycetota bacterium]
RRAKGGGAWTSRIILDLDTTGLGAVLGDMRFLGNDMALNLFAEKAGAADFLAEAAEDLVQALSARGFRLKPRFLALPPPPPPETGPARPDGRKAPPPAEPLQALPRRRGGLDVRG